MKALTLPIRKRVKNRTITLIECFRGIETEINLYEYNEKIGSLLLAEAPEWLRNVIRINEHQFEEIRAAK